MRYNEHHMHAHTFKLMGCHVTITTNVGTRNDGRRRRGDEQWAPLAGAGWRLPSTHDDDERLATGDKLLDTGKFFLNNLLSYFLIDLLFVLAIYLLTRDVVIYKWVV
jgi:hypothetical protein